MSQNRNSPELNNHNDGEAQEPPPSHQPSPSPSPSSSGTATGQASPGAGGTGSTPNAATNDPTSEKQSTNRENEKAPLSAVDDTNPATSKAPLENYSWEDLEERFLARMEACRKTEVEIGTEFGEWVEVNLFSHP